MLFPLRTPSNRPLLPASPPSTCLPPSSLPLSSGVVDRGGDLLPPFGRPVAGLQSRFGRELRDVAGGPGQGAGHSSSKSTFSPTWQFGYRGSRRRKEVGIARSGRRNKPVGRSVGGKVEPGLECCLASLVKSPRPPVPEAATASRPRMTSCGGRRSEREKNDEWRRDRCRLCMPFFRKI